MQPVTLATHLIWTTYGTWLPGDPGKPGHWSPLFDLYGRLVCSGHRLNVPDATTYEHALQRMTEPPKCLRDNESDLVAAVLSRHLAPALAGAPSAYACAIEPNHIHLLVGPVRERIDRFVGRLKGSSSAALRKHPNNWDRTRSWTAGYWKVFLFDRDAVCAVTKYIESHNLRRGIPARPYEWIQPA